MGYFTAQELTDVLEQRRIDRNDLRCLWHSTSRMTATLPFIERDEHGYNVEYRFNDEPIRMEDVEAWLRDFHASIIEGNFADWKAFRPWKMVDIYKDLPADKAWIGWEIETGWENPGDRSSVINEMFSAYNHVCTDNEGPAYGVELTWCPKAVGYWEEEGLTHPLLFVANVAQGLYYYEHEPGDHVGTHANISTPTSRTLTGPARNFVVSVLNESISSLTFDEREEFFGRGDLYAGFFPRSARDTWWIEGKLFNSTYHHDVAQKYIRVGDRLAAVMEAVSVAVKDWEEGQPYLYNTTCTNFVDVLRNGAAPVVVAQQGGWFRDGDSLDSCYDDDDYYDDDEDSWCEDCEECH